MQSRTRIYIAAVAAAVILSACNRAPAPEAPAPPTSAAEGPAIAAQPGNPSAKAAPVTPAETTHFYSLQRKPDACAVKPGGGVQVEAFSAEWRPHPEAVAPFWAPALSVTLCNTGPARAEARLRVGVKYEADRPFTASLPLPALAAGERIDLIQFPLGLGVPASIGQLWAEGHRPWPEWSLQLTETDGKLLGETQLKGGTPAPGNGAPLSEAELLRRTAWAQVDIGEGRTLLLASPSATYQLALDEFCGAPRGSITARSADWQLYLSRAGEAPVLLAELGGHEFEGGRTMQAAPASYLDTTFLFLGQYGSCAVPNTYQIWGYDQAKGEVYRPKMLEGAGVLRDATAAAYELRPGGTLVSRFYNNAGSAPGYHTRTYAWDGAQRTWTLTSDAVTTNP